MITRLHILVSCSNRKSLEIRPDLQFRNITGESIKGRLKEWTKRIDASTDKRVAAKHVYQGDHWQVSLSLIEAAAKIGIDAELWIGSAGYGLLHWRDAILGYSATFSARHEDSVVEGQGPNAELATKWWEGLARWAPNGVDGPRSVHELVMMDPKAAFMAVGSPTYFSAWRGDLERALDAIGDPQQFLLVSAGTQSIGKLESHLLPADARFQSHVNGAMVSLNARIAQLVLQQIREAGGISLDEIHKRLERLLEQLPDPQKYDRRRRSDAELIELIKNRLRNDHDIKRSPLLRLLRDEGYACEQRRFKQLYTQALEKL